VGLSTGVFRPAILRTAGHPWIRSFVTDTRPGRIVASRFVAGETLAEALATARELHGRGLRTMLDHLGENVEGPQQALAAREAYLSALAASADAEDVDAAISVKLTQLGLDVSVDSCWANLEPIVESAGEKDRLLMIDMESHSYVDATIEVFARAYARSSHVGIAIQSYLRRSNEDVFRLPEGCRVRLVKGAYLEPSDVVYTRKRDVDANYARLFTTLFAHGHPVDIATHDPVLIEGARKRVDAFVDGWTRAEFQMLYGVRRDLQSRLAGDGYPVRVYIPYGTEWYPYLTRRLAERPANVWFFVSNLVRTSR
jgi:proline dehydrogenase